MLVDSPLETPKVLQPLATASAKMYPEFAHEIEVESGSKVDLRDHGTILLLKREHLGNPQFSTLFRRIDLAEREPNLGMPTWEQEIEYRASLSADSLETPDEDFEEAFRWRFENAFHVKERSIDPRALTAAAVKAAKNRGVDFSSGDPVTAINISDDHVSGVTTSKTTFLAEKVVNCAGAWSSQLGPQFIPTRPVKGQMLCLAMHPRDLIRHVIRTPDLYLIPRSDGRLLVGATVEEKGFDKRTDPDTMKRFLQAAIELVPKLRDAKILEDWAGLRPGTPDNLPILGATSTPGYFIATGHFRDGILLAPITAAVMADVIEGRNPGHDLSAFAPLRFKNKPPTMSS
jgi:glycine/D-amino acid oxidase-like deaminating enzyme